MQKLQSYSHFWSQHFRQGLFCLALGSAWGWTGKTQTAEVARVVRDLHARTETAYWFAQPAGSGYFQTQHTWLQKHGVSHSFQRTTLLRQRPGSSVPALPKVATY